MAFRRLGCAALLALAGCGSGSASRDAAIPDSSTSGADIGRGGAVADLLLAADDLPFPVDAARSSDGAAPPDAAAPADAAAPLDASGDLAVVCTPIGLICTDTAYGCCPGMHCQADGTCGCEGDPCTSGYPTGCACGGGVYACIADPGDGGAPAFHCSGLAGKAGQLCKADSDCQSGLTCSSSVCTALACTGMACTVGYGGGGCCLHDAYCTGATSSSPKQCASACGVEGAGCVGSGDCCAGLWCLSGACTSQCAGLTCAGGCCSGQPYCVGLAGATATTCSATCGNSGDHCHEARDCCGALDCQGGICAQADCSGWSCGMNIGGCCSQAYYCTGVGGTSSLTCNPVCGHTGDGCFLGSDCCSNNCNAGICL
jgi:hypothetical protein